MAGPGPAARRRRLGLELRRLREQAGMTIEQVAAALEVSDSKISRIETAQVRATPRDVRDMLELYEVSDEHRDWLIQIAREARERAWWQDFGHIPVSNAVGLEAAATLLRSYAPLVLPGMLQTRDYAHIVLTTIRTDISPEEIQERIELRMARQGLLNRQDPPRLWAIIDEGALRRPVGGPAVMREQLERLIAGMALPATTIQVLPFSAGEHAGLDGQFDIYSYADASDPDVVYLENATSDLVMVDNADVIRRYVDIFGRLQAKALGPSDSEAFLVSLAEAYS